MLTNNNNSSRISRCRIIKTSWSPSKQPDKSHFSENDMYVDLSMHQIIQLDGPSNEITIVEFNRILDMYTANGKSMRMRKLYTPHNETTSAESNPKSDPVILSEDESDENCNFPKPIVANGGSQWKLSSRQKFVEPNGLQPVKGVFGDLDLPVIWSYDLKQIPGICMHQKKDGQRSSIIEINRSLMHKPTDLNETLVHQMCHAANWILYGKCDHSLDRWLTKIRNVYPDYTNNDECNYLYTYRCVLCASKAFAHKKIPRRIRCAHCCGPVEFLRNIKYSFGYGTPSTYKDVSVFIEYVKKMYKGLSRDVGRAHSEIMTYLYNTYETKYGKLLK